jgi:thiamine biosynthesis lipoprotein
MPLTGRLALLMVGLASVFSCSSPPRSQSELWLGTGCTITIYGPGARGAFQTAFRRVEEIHNAMSLQEPESELNSINNAATGEWTTVSADTARVLEEAVRISEETSGAFDFTVGALVRLWDIQEQRPASLPNPEAIRLAASGVDYRAVTVDGDRVQKTARGIVLDLGGIAKGYAADQAAEALRQSGVRTALLDFGGNILLIGSKPDGSPWRVGVQNPLDGRGRSIGILELEESSVVTSGVYERFFLIDDVRYHHILDPETGYPARTGLLSVTVVADSSMIADALSTAVFVLGPEKGLDLVRRTPGVEALLVTEDKSVRVTSGLGERFRLTDRDYRLED